MAHGTFALSLRCTGLSFRRVARAPRLFVSTCMSCGNEQSVPCAFLWSSSSGTRASAASPPARQNAKGMWESSRVKVEIRDVPREDGVSLLLLCCTFKGFSHRISDVYRLLSHLTLYDVQLLSREIGGRRGHFHLSQITRRTYYADETQTLGPQRLQMRCAAAEPRYAWLGCSAELSGRTSGLSSAFGRPPSARALTSRSRWSAGSATGIGSPTKGPSQRGAP